MLGLVRIGYWRLGGSGDWPDPHALVDLEWDPDERAEVASYLRRGFIARRYLGLSRCRFCDSPVGALELSDGVFLWPEGLAHYVEAHAVRLPERFMNRVRVVTESLESAEVDEQWWRGLAAGDSA